MVALAPGHPFGPFLVEAVVGFGGMGVVYRARERATGRLVALKVLRSRDGAPPSDEDRARFVREARLAAGLVHPNVVTIHASGAVGTTPYLAMEWIDGATLATRIKDTSLALATRIDVIAAVADALAYAHENGVVHRDLKPTNVMLDGRGVAKLVDFGIAKQALDHSQPLGLANTLDGVPFATRAGVVLGTPSYMAPEQMISPEVDARVDQFAWGVLAYELLSGVHPRETLTPGDGAFPVARARPLAWQRPEVPEPLAAVVHRAMAYERDARFATMRELVRALEAARNPTSLSVAGMPYALPPTTNGTMQAVVGTVNRGPSTGPEPTSDTGRATARWVVLSTAALLVSAAAIVAGSMLLAKHAQVVVPLGTPRGLELVDGFDDVPFEGGKAAVARAGADTVRALEPCIDARVLVEDELKVTFRIDADGRVEDIPEVDYCRRKMGNLWLCSEMGKPVKRDYPEPPAGVLSCVHDAASAMTFPRLERAPALNGVPADVPETVEVTVELDAR